MCGGGGCLPCEPFVEFEGDVEGEEHCQGDEPDCDVVWPKPLVNFGLFKRFDCLKVFGCNKEVALFSQLQEFFRNVREI